MSQIPTREMKIKNKKERKMETLLNLVNGFLGLGSTIVMPVIIIILGLIIGVKFGKSVSAGILLAVAFTGVNLIVSYMCGVLAPPAENMTNMLNLSFDTLDFGWPAASAVAWAWTYAALCFPIQIGVNILMIAIGKTKTLNVDMWNVWVKCFMGAMVSTVTGKVWIGLIMVAVWVAVELLCADAMRKSVFSITGIPGISCPHSYILDAIVLTPVMWLLEKIPGFNKLPKITAENLREKIGIFGENHVVGFILGTILGICGGFGVVESLTLGVQAGTALVLLPVAAKYFMQALNPIASAMSAFMRKRFPGKNLYIGLDWPVLAGDATLWTSAILLIPVLLILAAILPGNTVFPFASIVFIDATICATVVARSDLIKTYILSIINAIVKLYVATHFAAVVTQLAVQSGTVTVTEGFSKVIWIGMGWLYWACEQVGTIFTGNFAGILVLIGSAALIWLFLKIMKEKNKAMCDEGIYDYDEEPEEKAEA